jgi:hypothetical protein
MMNTEEFVTIEQAVKTSTAPPEIAAAFDELTALREQLKEITGKFPLVSS